MPTVGDQASLSPGAEPGPLVSARVGVACSLTHRVGVGTSQSHHGAGPAQPTSALSTCLDTNCDTTRLSPAAGGKHTVLNLLYHKRGEFSKRSPTWHIPTGALGHTSPLFTGLRASLSRSLETLVGHRVVPLRCADRLEFSGSWKGPCQSDCAGLCVSGPAGINLSTGETEAEYLKCPGTC